MPMYKRARMGIAYLPQEPSIFRKLTVEENFMAILELTPLSPAEREGKLEGPFGRVEGEPLAKQKAYTLSGGESGRVEIARALVLQPHLSCWTSPSWASTLSRCRTSKGSSGS